MPNSTISQAKIEGNILRLPPIQLDRAEYVKVAKALELIGGKWKGGKTMGFVFPSDPTPLVEKLLSGDKIVTAKKEFQYFATPEELADDLVAYANPQPGEVLCEPSAGQGAIVRAINRHMRDRHGLEHVTVHCFEAMPLNKEILLQTLDNVIFEGDDFLACPRGLQFDVIVANPPFSQNRDVEHIMCMWEHLAPGGRLVSLASPHWEFCDHKRERAFRDFLATVGAAIQEVPKGAFKESGTMVETRIIRIQKPST